MADNEFGTDKVLMALLQEMRDLLKKMLDNIEQLLLKP